MWHISKVWLSGYRSNDQFTRPKRRFWNLNADSEVKVKVTGVKILTCMVRCCPKACVCQKLKVYLNWYGSYDQFSKPKRRFWNLNADSELKVKVTGDKILTCMERSCPKACVRQILKVYLNWNRSYKQFSKPKRKFWNLNALWGTGHGHRGKNLDMHGKVMSRGICVPNIKGILNCYWSYEQFSKPKRRYWNLNADSEVKVKVTRVNILTCMGRFCPKACVCQILKLHVRILNQLEDNLGLTMNVELSNAQRVEV